MERQSSNEARQNLPHIILDPSTLTYDEYLAWEATVKEKSKDPLYESDRTFRHIREGESVDVILPYYLLRDENFLYEWFSSRDYPQGLPVLGDIYDPKKYAGAASVQLLYTGKLPELIEVKYDELLPRGIFQLQAGSVLEERAWAFENGISYDGFELPGNVVICDKWSREVTF